MKHGLVILSFIALGFSANAQKGEYLLPEQSSFTDRLYFGGGFGLSGGSNGASVSLSPLVGYMINNRVSVGIGATYQYFKIDQPPFYVYSDNRWGGNVFGRINLFRQIFAYGEYSFLNYAFAGDQNDRRVAERLPIGLGLSQPIGPRSSLNMVAAYDLLYLENGAYTSPWVFAVFFSI
jgi:hypothetical protein